MKTRHLNSMVRFRGSHLLFTCIIAWSSEIFRSTDGSGITWLEPPPSETITHALNITEANKSLVEGSLNAGLSCNFSLSADLSIVTTSIHFGGTAVANFVQNQKALSVSKGFKSRFNVTWVPNKLTLIFFQVTSADKGEFRCDVLTLGSPGAVIQTWKRKIQVSLLVPSSISEVTGATVIEGGNVTLKCIVEGKPTPTITWTRISDNKVVTMPLINFSRNNATEFKCTANNGIGASAMRKVFVDVQYAVERTGSGKNVTWSEGGKNFSFSCPFVGNPEPNITWYKEGDMSGTKISIGKQLTIITDVGDSGERLCYTCVASNSLGTPAHITQCLLIEHPTSPTNFKSTSIAKGDSWTIIGIVAGVGVFMAIVIGLVIWWVCKNRSSRTETKQSELQCLEVDHMDKGERLE